MAILGPRPSATAKRREWRDQHLRRLQLERIMAARVSKELGRAARAAAAAFARDRQVSVDMALEDHDERLRVGMNIDLRRTFQAFGDRTLSSGKSFDQRELKDTENSFAAAQAEYLEIFGAEKVVLIADTTKRTIGNAIAAGVNEGENLEQIQKRIRAAGEGVIGRLRSAVIARTEVHSAAAAAEDEMVKAMGIESIIKREWLDSDDQRVRDSHDTSLWTLEQRVKPNGQLFEVGGALLRFPGDPFGPAQEIIMCRCVLGYITPDPTPES